jgi:hypothetical protein
VYFFLYFPVSTSVIMLGVLEMHNIKFGKNSFRHSGVVTYGWTVMVRQTGAYLQYARKLHN